MKVYMYRDKRIFVAPLTDGDTYGTVWLSSSGGSRRVQVKALPVRATREDAQADLDKFAQAKKLRTAD